MAEQSISHEIIYGNYDSVKKLINAGANVNEKDDWGFVPLIETVLCNKPSIAYLLLENGAGVDERDMTGQTALQWAVNHRNLELCKLFLDHQANPNHYSNDGQPILVNPILRGEHEIIQMLVAKGADLTLPNDYINAKLIGHRFELVGKGDIINTKGQFIELNFEGFYLEFTVGIILRTLTTFFNSEFGKKYAAYATVIQKIIRTLKTASELVQYKYTNEGPKKHEKIIKELLNQDTVIVPVSYEGHAITFAKAGKLLAKCDRGVKRIVDTVVAYQVGNPYALNPGFLEDLMYNAKSNSYIHTDIKKILNLNPFTTMPARYQLSGNCSWANVEASVPALMFMLMFRGDINNRGEIATLKNSIMSYYDTWTEWDKDRVLGELINDFYIQKDKPRKAAKVAILGAILLQRCRSNHPKEVLRAKEILKVMTEPEYNFFLKDYIKVYCTKAAGEIGKNFAELLRMCGLNFKTLTLNRL